MRKYQQRQILELLRTVEQAQSEGLFADCQDGAISIGNFIESIEGEGTQTVTLLEEYCELLFRASKGEIKEKKLRKHIIKIENCVREELKPNRIEIVFLPYQYNMFDSLESVYLAAKNDPCCDAYVVPIPFYELNRDGTLGKMHYDGDQYPKDIPVTDWQEYDIEKRHPDVIFTHYAYDNNVSNASIHPAFYSRRLRELCEFLIYVPYFVAPVDTVEEYNGFLPGVLYANRVVVQSDAVRKSYIDHYKKFSDKGRFGEAEEKFVALGSPKYDKVINTKRENCGLPPEWEHLIYNPDGSMKKIILYNTHMFSWLNGGEQYFKKIQYVFDTFRNRNDVVLWWRPHPNTELNFRTKRPQLLSEYHSVVSDFKREKWGIYDDSSDLHRAIAWSDAYYGDWSSLVPMYQVTGKPVMIGNSAFIKADIMFLPTIPNFIHYISDDIWLFDSCINAHFKMSKTKWEPKFLSCLPGVKNQRYGPTLYQKSCEKDGFLYFSPFIAKEIAVYSMKDNVFETIEYKEIDSKTKIAGDFSSAILYGDYVFFTPYVYPAIVRLNTITREISYYSDWVTPLTNLIGDIQGGFFSYPLAVGSSILLVALETNAVVEFNMESCTSIIHEVGEKDYRYRGICFDGSSYWLSPRHNTPVVKWNLQTDETKVFKELYCGDNDIQDTFHPIIYCNGYVWLLPYAAEHAIKIDIHTETVSIASEFELGEDERLDQTYDIPLVHGDSIYAYNISKATIIEYNCATKERREEKILYSPETMPDVEPLIAKTLLIDPNMMQTKEDCCYYEGDHIRLRDFVNYLVLYGDSEEAEAIMSKRKEIARAINTHMDGTSGSEIYKYTKDIILDRR